MTTNERLKAILAHWGECENYTDGNCRDQHAGRVVFSDTGAWNEYCAYCSVEWALEAK